MIRVLDGRDYDDADTFVSELNKARLANRKRWICYVGRVGGHLVEVKTYDHGDLQILRVGGRDMRLAEYGLNVSAWKAEIANAITRAAA